MKRIGVLLPALVLLAGVSQPSVGADAGVRVIVNPQVKGNVITRTVLTQIFLKQAPRYATARRPSPSTSR